MRARVFFGLLLLLVLATVLTVQRGWLFSFWGVPAYLDPFSALQLDDPPHLWTALKLQRLNADLDLCFDFMSTTAWRFQRIAPHQAAPDCVLPESLRLSGLDRGVDHAAIKLSSPTLLSCPMAASLALYERHAMRPILASMTSTHVVAIDHLGSFACRNIGSSNSGRRSEHASANALDIAAFQLADGRQLRIARDWNPDSASAPVLRALRDGACPWFQSVLGPDYNAAHQDHFHLDRGRSRICR